jgi:4-amino-4-deoxy-L-arabinose transferase-like glycosyltransferase
MGGNGGFAQGGTQGGGFSQVLAAPPAGGSGGAGMGSSDGSDTALANYLVANRGSATWIVAVSDAMSAAQLELSTGEPVMAMGGWSGSDNALTLDQLKADVASGKLRYVIVSGQGGRGGSGSSEIDAWIVANGRAVTISGSSTTLYDLSGAATA